MGVLEAVDPLVQRQRVLRANLRERSKKNGSTYRKTVESFAQEIERSPATVFMWLTKDSSRPFPEKHYNALVKGGYLDPRLTHIDGRPADSKKR